LLFIIARRTYHEPDALRQEKLLTKNCYFSVTFSCIVIRVGVPSVSRLRINGCFLTLVRREAQGLENT
ncbi:MAG: hypothetical protein WCG04_02045, partial [Alphaproteobacteria bacterium]